MTSCVEITEQLDQSQGNSTWRVWTLQCNSPILVILCMQISVPFKSRILVARLADYSDEAVCDQNVSLCYCIGLVDV